MCNAQEQGYNNVFLYSQSDGLSSSNIHKIIQDNKSFLWIATQDGLNRFDGKNFIVFNKNKEAKFSLFSNDIRNIFLDTSRNTIWVICNNGGINGIDINTCEVKYNFPYADSSLETEWRICALFFNNKIYIGTSGGLQIFNTKNLSFETINLSLRNNLSFNGVNDIRVIDIDPQQNIWLSILNRGIIIFNPNTNTLIKKYAITNFSMPHTKAFWPLCGNFRQKEKVYFIGTNKGLYKIDYNDDYTIATTKLNSELNPLETQPVFSLLTSSEKDLIICGSTLYKFNNHKLTPIYPSQDAGKAWLENSTYVFEDNQNNYWIGCNQGLCFLSNKHSPFLSIKNGPEFNDKLGHVFSLCAVNNNETLIGTREGAFLLSGNKQFKAIYNKSIVQNIFRLTKNIFVLSGGDEIKLYDNGKVLSAEDKFPEFYLYRNWQFNSCINLNDSVYVIGTENNRGILLWNSYTHNITHLQTSADSKTNAYPSIVNTLFRNVENQVIILSDFSFTIMDPETLISQNFILKDSASGKPIGIFMDMAETKDNYWINAYGTGLIKLNKNFKLQRIFTKNNGLSNEGLYKMFNYKDSLLILTSNRGVSLFTIKNETFKTFFIEDGLQDNIFEEASGDNFNNIFYAGGANGFTKINPTLFLTNTQPPKLFFTSVKMQTLDNQVFDTTNLSSALFNVLNTSFQTQVFFTGLSYQNPKRVEYAYRINEINSDWLSLGIQNFISLIGLDPGTYHLEVKASNEDGYWSEPKTLVLILEPKWYQTWWFYAFIALAICSLLYSFYRYRIMQIKNQQIKLHQVREQIASDLHDDIGSTLNSLKIFTHLAEESSDKKKYFTHIKKSLQQTTEGLRDMIWVLDDKQDTAEELINRLHWLIKPIADASEINIQFTTEGINNIILNKTEKRNLLMIVKEAVNNCIKYAGCKNINVSFIKNASHKILVIEDDGRGFEEDKIIPGNGLNNIRTRAKQINYDVLMHSAPGSGTIITLTSKNI